MIIELNQYQQPVTPRYAQEMDGRIHLGNEWVEFLKISQEWWPKAQFHK